MSDWHDEPLVDGGRSILQSLAEERIVTLTVTPKGLKIVEACDDYFGLTLSPKQVDRLIEELVDLRTKLQPPMDKANNDG